MRKYILSSLLAMGAIGLTGMAQAGTTTSPYKAPFDTEYQRKYVEPEVMQPYIPIDHTGRTAATQVYFDSGDFSIAPDTYMNLDRMVDLGKQYDIDAIYLIGNTDSDGSKQFNKTLGKKRAETVATYLMTQGINKSKIHIVSDGEMKPKALNINETGKRTNRRVDVLVNYSHPKQ